MHSQAAQGESSATVARRVVALCWLVILFDGYDLIMYGTIVPSLLRHPTWDVSPGQAGAIGAYALTGMLVGALVVGTLTDLFGRRRLVIGCLIWFSVASGLSAAAPSPEIFGLLRFVLGLGLGGLLPTVSALTLEYAPPARRNFLYGVMFSGYPLGGLVAAFLALLMVPAFGFRAMPLAGLAGLLVVPLVLRHLPESVSFLRAKGRHDEADRLAARLGSLPEGMAAPGGLNGQDARNRRGAHLTPVARLFHRDVLAATTLFWGATFLCLLLIYGLYTWLPEIMRGSGYSLGSALVFLLVLNLGGVLGMFAAARAADRFGTKTTTTVACVLAGASIVLLSVRLPLFVNYLLVTVAGTGVIGTQVLINAYVGQYYPVAARATALGWSLGIGRIGAIVGPPLGAIVVASALGVTWNFYLYGLAAFLAALLIALVPRRPGDRSTTSPALGAGSRGETVPARNSTIQ